MRLGGLIGVGVAASLGCGPQVVVPQTETESDGEATGTTTGPSPSPSTTVAGDTTRGDDDDADVDVDDGPSGDDFPPVDFGGGSCAGDCTPKLDLLVVVDNSAGTGEEQAALARSMVRLVDQLQSYATPEGNVTGVDTQVMVTTTDVGNPQCTPFRPEGYDPAQGSPVATPCISRLAHFTSLDGTTTVPNVCTDICPVEIAPDDPFVAFVSADDDNVPQSDLVDIDGDGDFESPAAQALACLLPQGINGCGFEAPLEAMLQALNPMAEWNAGPRPFMRQDAALGIVLLTDEADCSVSDYSAMENPDYQEINPDTGVPQATSAICWNAGVACDGPDAQGVYSDCASTDGPLHPLTRYTNYLGDYLGTQLNKPVFMLAIVGVPPTTAHDPNPPYAPVEGGEPDLVVRDWIDGQYPAGDILPAEWASGVDAARKNFLYGIGPACTGEDGAGGFMGQGIPNHRVMEVCHALDAIEPSRCAIESICASDHDAALAFITGQMTLIGPPPTPPD